MGQYFDWKNRYRSAIKSEPLLKKLKALNFIHSVVIKDHQILGKTLVDHLEITEMTQEEWTGYFDGSVGHYIVLFKSEIDAMAFKLTFL